MSDIVTEAKEKLAREHKAARYDQYARIMKDGVKKTLVQFCEQSEVFAEIRENPVGADKGVPGRGPCDPDLARLQKYGFGPGQGRGGRAGGPAQDVENGPR